MNGSKRLGLRWWCPGKMNVGNFESIKCRRRNSIIWKYSTAIIGAIFFFAALYCMIQVIIPISSFWNKSQNLLNYENTRYSYTIQYTSYWKIESKNNSQTVVIFVPSGQNKKQESPNLTINCMKGIRYCIPIT